ncbi:MAG: hypothetical protein R3E52_12800 [Burkholderiaceae bacterium]
MARDTVLKYVLNTFVFKMAINSMLHRFAFTNFQSFRERTEVNWLLDGKVPEAVWSTRSASGERAVTVMAVIGANASGKTALLGRCRFSTVCARTFAANPGQLTPFEPHFAAQDQPSELELGSDGRWRALALHLALHGQARAGGRCSSTHAHELRFHQAMG